MTGLVQAYFESAAEYVSKTLTKLSTFALVAALVLIVWKGPWLPALQGKQLDFLGWGMLGSIIVWGICTLHTTNAVRDLSFKANGIEASVDFNEVPPKEHSHE